MAINGLMSRRSFIVTEAPETLTDDLAAIDRALVLLGFDEDPSAFMPCGRNQRIFRKGEMIRLIRVVLRDAAQPMSSREICLAIVPNDSLLSDKKRINQATSRVYKKLCIEVKSGRVRRVEGYPIRWILRTS